jgi:hypothetical protein
MAITFRPLTHWPAGRPRTPNGARKRGSFNTTAGKSFKDLEEELRLVGGSNARLQVAVADERRDLTRAGELRADARATDVGIVVTFDKSVGGRSVPVTLACDRFQHWDSNLRAIVLTLQALRAVDRYDCTASGEQYRGFAALPSSTTTALSTEQAAKVLATRTNAGAITILAQAEIARGAYREARAKAHPDAGGSSAEFNLVQEAARVLGVHHGVTL